MLLPARATIVEVSLRDGIQTEPVFIPTERKIAIARAIALAGVPVMEATSFVHPRIVPQLADAEAVFAGLVNLSGTSLAALVPNEKGAGRALAAGADEIHWVIMASETFQRKNVRMSVRESLDQFGNLLSLCQSRQPAVRVIGGIGTAFGCPFEGDVPPARVLNMAAEMVALGAAGICLADTTGMANPLQVVRLAGGILDRWPHLVLSLHFHNTRGMGLANLLGGLEAGVTCFEASLGGLGGCPFAPKATGNICTEDTVHMLHEMGIETGIDLEALLDAARLMEETLGRVLPGQLLRAGPRSQIFPA